MSTTYMTTKELSEKIKYKTRTINESLKDVVLLEGRHYFRPFGGRKILWIWENIKADMHCIPTNDISIPLSGGRVCNV